MSASTSWESKVSASDLISMGKRAAMDFLNNGTTLVDAVVKEASVRNGMTTEHVRRVVEVANSSAFTHSFEKRAGNKIIEFPVADPKEVLARLEGKVRPLMVKTAADEYSAPPPTPAFLRVAADLAIAKSFGVTLESEAMKTAAGDDGVEEALLHLRAGSGYARVIATDMEKTASVEAVKERTAEPPNPATLRNEIRRASEWAEKHASDCGDSCQMSMMVLDARSEDLGKKIAAHLLDGGNAGELLSMMSMLKGEKAAGESFVSALPEIKKLASAYKLKEADVLADAALYEMESSKLASLARQVDFAHPVVKSFLAHRDALTKLAENASKLREALVLLERAEAQKLAFEKKSGMGTKLLMGAGAAAAIPPIVKKFKQGTEARNVAGGPAFEKPGNSSEG